MKSVIILVNLLLLFSIEKTESAGGGFDWTFVGNTYGPATWTNNYKACGGARQSPINIETSKAIYDKHLKPFNLTRGSGTSNYTITNSGLNFEITFGTTNWTATFEGSRECFRLLQIHFHWGSVNSKGAEHQINGKDFAIELHFVMWNCLEFSTSAAAFTGVNGLAVMGVLYEVDNSAPANAAMDTIVTALGNSAIRQCPCSNPSDKATASMPYFDVNTLLPTTRTKFYRYAGSLTTPPCTENVMWSVYNDPMKITQTQIAAFRNLLNRATNNEGIVNMVDNSRPPQPLNGNSPSNAFRFVSSSFSTGSFSASISRIGILVSILAVLINISW